VLSNESKQIAIESKKMFEEQLCEKLEGSDHGKFICIEPKSGDYFLGNTFDDAAKPIESCQLTCIGPPGLVEQTQMWPGSYDARQRLCRASGPIPTDANWSACNLFEI